MSRNHPDPIPVSPAQLALNLAGRNAAEAVRLLTTLAEGGNTEAQLMLGQLYLDGRGVAVNTEQALHWFRQAAGKSDPMAVNMVGRCLENGWGTAIDLAAAAEHYRRAAESGLDWGQYNYANLLRTGQGIPRDMAQAFVLYQQAAAQGLAKAMNLVGRFHHEGWGMPVDVAKAGEWYRQSAEGGDFRGQISHAGLLAEDGRIEEACAWLRQALKTAVPKVRAGLADTLAHSPHAPFRQIAAEIRER